MSRIVVTMAPEDFAVFSAVAQHPYSATVTTPKHKNRAITENLKKVIRKRILTYVAEHPGVAFTQIRQEVKGTESVVVSEIKGLRQEGLLRAECAGKGMPVRHYPADIIVEEQEAA